MNSFTRQRPLMRSGMLICCFTAAVLHHTATFGADAGNVLTKEGYPGIKYGPGLEPVPVEACGLTAVEIVFRLYDVSYHVPTVVGLLDPTAAGVISVARIKETLATAGIKCDPRKDVASKELLSYLDAHDAGAVMLCSIPENAIGHIALLTRRGDDQVTVSDIKGVRRYSRTNFCSRFDRSPATVCLFVEKQRNYFEGILDRLSIEPAVMDLGNLSTGDVLRRKFTIRNLSDRSIVLNPPKVGCSSCISAELETYRIDADQSGALSVEGHPTSLFRL